MTIKVFGIKNCNTMKKCFAYLMDKGIDYEFFDYKKSVLTQTQFEHFVQAFGKDKVINKQGTTYRKLDDNAKTILASNDMTAIYELVKVNQSLLKRPIVLGTYQDKDVALIGFDQEVYDKVLN